MKTRIVLFACIFVVGYTGVLFAAKTQYIPPELVNSPAGETVRFHVAPQSPFWARDVFVDGVKKKRWRVILSPGPHNIEYRSKGATAAWVDVIMSMKARGFTLSSDGKTFTKRDVLTGRVLTAKPLGIKRFEWQTKSIRFCTEAGKHYVLGNRRDGTQSVFEDVDQKEYMRVVFPDSEDWIDAAC